MKRIWMQYVACSGTYNHKYKDWYRFVTEHTHDFSRQAYNSGRGIRIVLKEGVDKCQLSTKKEMRMV